MSETKPTRLMAEVDFGRDGKQHGYVRLYHSVHESAYGFIPIPITVVRNGAGPTALFTGGTHGDEYEGQVALSNLARTLDPREIKGRVIILPMMNFPAAMAGSRTSPIDAGNLNRSFPGDADGTPTQQIAAYVTQKLAPLADLACDLHSGGSSLNYTPCALIERDDDAARFARTKAALAAFAAPLAYVAAGSQGTGADRTLTGAAKRLGIPTMGSELGGAGTLNRDGLAIAERGVINLLAHMGILPASRAVPGATRYVAVGGDDYFVHARESGIFEPLAEPGAEVKAGQPAARIHTPETPGSEPSTQHFARDGMVLVRRVPGRTVRGDCLFHLGTDIPAP